MARHPTSLDEDDRLRLKALLARSRPLTMASALVSSFAEMLTARTGQNLPEWIEATLAADLPGLRRFAKGLAKDFDAVTAGLTLPYNSGAVEGNVGRLKALKRQMYGRANLDLLRIRVLLDR
jgi:transposase